MEIKKTLIMSAPNFVHLLVLSTISLSSIVALKIEEKVCEGTNSNYYLSDNSENHYRLLKNRYTNCTIVNGNLELRWIPDERSENFDFSFLQHIREVSGYVLIAHVYVKQIIFPSLQIIKGQTLFKSNLVNDELSLVVMKSKLCNLEIPNLTEISNGSVWIQNNIDLYNIQTFKWDEIIRGKNAKCIDVNKLYGIHYSSVSNKQAGY